MRNILVKFIIFVLGFGALCPAQTADTSSSKKGNTGIEGTVSDATGAVVVGATVVVHNAAGDSKTAVTGAEGKFRITGLTSGSYDISVTAKDFAAFSTVGFNVVSGEIGALDVQMQPAAATANVNVQATQHIETENAEVSGTISKHQLVSVGLNGRNFTQVMALAPGVSNQTGQDEAKVGVVGSAKFSVNGGRTEYNTFDVDGSDVLNTDIAASHGHSTLLVYPSIDAIQEMKVLTSNYGAQYGRSASGTVLVTTKSGGSQFHGNAYEFLRNEAFNDRNYFDGPGKAPLYRRNDFGGTLGGPIFIPGFYNTKKDKSFFFFSEEFRKERSPIEFNQAVPSDAERGWNPVTQSYSKIGDFSDVCPVLDNGNPTSFNRTKYPDCPQLGTVPVTFARNQILIDPTATAILRSGLIPRANSATGCNSSTGSCYVATVSPPTSWREELVKLDHNFGSGLKSTKLSFSAVHDHWQTTTAIPQWENQINSFPSVLNSFQGPGISGIVHATTVFSPSLVNDFSLGLIWQHITLTDAPGAGVSLDRSSLDSSPYPIGKLFNNQFGNKLPGIVISGTNAAYGGSGFSVDTSYMPWFHQIGTGTLRDDVSKVVGKHTLQFGIQFLKARRSEMSAANGANTGDVQGVLTYKNRGSFASTGNAFSDFLFNNGGGGAYDPTAGGGIFSYQQDNTQGSYKVRYWVAEPYVQDDWRITSRLMLNLGIRLSLFGNWEPVNQTLYNWEASAFNPTLAASSNISVNPFHAYLQQTTGSGIGAITTPVPLNINALNPVMTNGLVRCGANGVPASCQSSHLVNPAPRIGFAWDPTGNSKTSIRAGYGVFFEHGTGSEANAGSLMGNPPQVLSVEEDYPTNYYQIGYQNPSNHTSFTPIAYPLNLLSIPSKTVWPYVQQWSFGAQQEVSKDTTVTVSYVGTKGTHLAAAMQLNQFRPVSELNNPFGLHEPITANFCAFSQVAATNPFDPFGFFRLANGYTLYYKDNPAAVLALEAACDGTPATGGSPGVSFPLNLLRPYKGIGQIYAIDNVASSIYHSLQFTLRHNRGPLDLGISYTYGHSIDTASDRYESTFVDSFNLAANRASSDFDHRHLVNVTYVYSLPALRLLEKLHKGLNCTEGDAEVHNTDCANVPLLSQYGGPSKLTRILLDGWALSGITTYQTGTPFSVVNGASSSGVSVQDNAGRALGLGPSSYPDVVNAASCHPVAGGSFGPLLASPCMFVAPRGLTQGNAGRNFMNNPSRANFDMALLKNFKLLGEGRDLQFRAEAFNIFNQTQFEIYDPTKGNTASNTISCYGTTGNYSAGASSCLTGNGFLHPVEAHRPRTLQLALKLEF